MNIELLNWDSEFFNLKIGKVNITEDNEFDWYRFKETADSEKYDLIYVFKYKKMFPLEIILKAELDLVDIQLTMSRSYNKADYLNIPYDFRTDLNEKEKNECYTIAEETSIVSRFYKEKNIGVEKTKVLYRKWIDNALNKSFADGLLIIKNENNQITGIHIIKTELKTGKCSLIGVSSSGKGKGVGTKLWQQAFSYWANNSNIEKCIVPFSLYNSESFNFHLRMGFNKVEETKYIYHYRNNKN